MPVHTKFCVELWHLWIGAFFSWIPTRRPNDHQKQNLDNIECELYGASWTAHLFPPHRFPQAVMQSIAPLKWLQKILPTTWT